MQAAADKVQGDNDAKYEAVKKSATLLDTEVQDKIKVDGIKVNSVPVSRLVLASRP